MESQSILQIIHYKVQFTNDHLKYPNVQFK